MYLQCSVLYAFTDENGNDKKKKELYLQRAETFTEAEAKQTELILGLGGNRELKDLKKTNITQVLEYDKADVENLKFYKVKLKFDAEKPFAETVLCPVRKIEEVLPKVKIEIQAAVDYEIESVVKTGILDVLDDEQ